MALDRSNSFQLMLHVFGTREHIKECLLILQTSGQIVCMCTDMLPCVFCVLHPHTWVCATWEESFKSESVSDLLSPSCSASPQSMQSFADDQRVTNSLPKLWSGYEAHLF